MLFNGLVVFTVFMGIPGVVIGLCIANWYSKKVREDMYKERRLERGE